MDSVKMSAAMKHANEQLREMEQLFNTLIDGCSEMMEGCSERDITLTQAAKDACANFAGPNPFEGLVVDGTQEDDEVDEEQVASNWEGIMVLDIDGPYLCSEELFVKHEQLRETIASSRSDCQSNQLSVPEHIERAMRPFDKPNFFENADKSWMGYHEIVAEKKRKHEREAQELAREDALVVIWPRAHNILRLIEATFADLQTGSESLLNHFRRTGETVPDAVQAACDLFDGANPFQGLVEGAEDEQPGVTPASTGATTGAIDNAETALHQLQQWYQVLDTAIEDFDVECGKSNIHIPAELIEHFARFLDRNPFHGLVQHIQQTMLRANIPAEMFIPRSNPPANPPAESPSTPGDQRRWGSLTLAGPPPSASQDQRGWGSFSFAGLPPSAPATSSTEPVRPPFDVTPSWQQGSRAESAPTTETSPPVSAAAAQWMAHQCIRPHHARAALWTISEGFARGDLTLDETTIAEPTSPVSVAPQTVQHASRDQSVITQRVALTDPDLSDSDMDVY